MDEDFGFDYAEDMWLEMAYKDRTFLMLDEDDFGFYYEDDYEEEDEEGLDD